MTMRDSITVVTGASEGLGQAIATRLCSSGAKCWLVSRNEPALKVTVEDIRSKGATADYCVCDVTSKQEVDVAVSRILHIDGRIDILVNNAGVWLQGEPSIATAEDTQRVLQVNTLGTIFMTQAILPVMRDQGSGHILNIISDSGLEADGNWPIYSATKFGVRGFTEGLRKSLSESGIRVTAAYPGGIGTKFYLNAGIPYDEHEPWMMTKESVADIVHWVLSCSSDANIDEIVIRKHNQA